MRQLTDPLDLRRARAMRAGLTEAERKLWYALRDRRLQSLKFIRVARVGPYIVDFLCVSQKLIIEAYGSQHLGSPRDLRRDAWFGANGYRLLRFSDHEVLSKTEIVLATIAAASGLDW